MSVGEKHKVYLAGFEAQSRTTHNVKRATTHQRRYPLPAAAARTPPEALFRRMKFTTPSGEQKCSHQVARLVACVLVCPDKNMRNTSQSQGFLLLNFVPTVRLSRPTKGNILESLQGDSSVLCAVAIHIWSDRSC